MINNPKETKWDTLNIDDSIKASKLYIYYSPDSILVLKLLKLIPITKSIKLMEKGFQNRNLMTGNIPIIFYYNVLSINNETTNYDSLQLSDIVLINLTVSIFFDEHINRTFNQFTYLNAIHAICMAFEDKKYFKNNTDKRILVGGLPDVYDRPLTWPGMYMLTLFVIMGCFIINFHELNNSYQFPVARNKRVFPRLISLFFVYNLIGVIGHASFIPLLMFLGGFNILTKWPIFAVFLIFTLSYNTALFTAALIAMIKSDIYILLYGTTIFIAPQILYIFCYGCNLDTSTVFQYMSMISPFFSAGWLLTIIETFEMLELIKKEITVTTTSEIGIFMVPFILSNVIFWFISSLFIFCVNHDGFLIIAEHILRKCRCFEDFKTIKLKKSHESTADSYSNANEYSDFNFLDSPGSSSDFRFNENFSNHKQKRSPALKFSKLSWKTMPSTFTSQIIKQIPKRRHSNGDPSSQNCIVVKSLYKFFADEVKEIHALKGFSMTAKRNFITAIIGPNGSGKSTLINILGGKLLPSQGYFKINDVRLQNNRHDHIFSQIAVYRDYETKLYFLTAEEYLSFFIAIGNVKRPKHEIRQTITKLATILQINSFLTTKLGMCSEIIVRLVKIIGIFIINTPIVLLDEPYRGLDFKAQHNVNCLFKERQVTQSIIIATSTSSTVETCADRIVLIKNGKSIFQAKSKNIRRSNRLGFRLICHMDKNAGDYSIIMHIKSLYPNIMYEFTIDDLIQFRIPNKMRMHLNQICLDLLKNSSKYGLNNIKVDRMNLQMYFEEIFHRNDWGILNNEDHMNTTMLLRVMYKNKSKKMTYLKIYSTQFLAMFMNKLATIYRFSNQTTVAIVLPLLSIMVTVGIGVVFNDNRISYDRYPNYVDEIAFGIPRNASDLTINITEQLMVNSSKNKIYYDLKFEDFTFILLQSAMKQPVFYKNSTKVAVYFVEKQLDLSEIIILSNFKNIIAKVFEIIEVYSIRSVKVTFYNISNGVNHVKDNIKIEKNFFLRVTYISLIIFVNSLFSQRERFKYDKKNTFVKSVAVDYTICFLPQYVLNILTVCVFNSFLILLITLLSDFGFTEKDENTEGLVILLFLFGLADLAFKTLLGKIFNYSPASVFFFIVLDLAAFFMTSVISVAFYKLYLKTHGYPFTIECSSSNIFWLAFLIILIPASNFNNGLVSYLQNPSFSIENSRCGNQLFSRAIDGFHSSYTIGFVFLVLFIQWIVCFLFLLIINNPFVKHCFFLCDFVKIKSRINALILKRKNPRKSMDNSLLTLRNVSYLDGKNRLLFNCFNWKIYEGKISLILGSNGSGKSLLSKLIVGHKKPTSGDITLQNEDLLLSELSKNTPKTSYSSQTPVLFEELTIGEFFLFFSKLRCQRTKEIELMVDLILNELGLLNETHRLIRNLSPLIVKKISIGISILGFPNIIVLDDPLANLDYGSQQSVISLIKLAKYHKSTIIITSSEIFDLHHIVDNALILRDYQSVYADRWVDMPTDVGIGYYLTIIFDEMIDEKELEYMEIERYLSIKYENTKTISIFNDTVIYFIPCINMKNINSSSLVIFLEQIITPRMNILQYLINLNFYDNVKYKK